ncbi:uncharacterized protein CEXT_740061 [Caerostris extrusa]|uniref:Uncharacterized protein n=1 Tax=Caerostris extrusa TaxID=172846 RepID=A0AAV4M4J0_CAEEX|nr:uncharacterized protein CEXT_740061 [Caerostris extrusa]
MSAKTLRRSKRFNFSDSNPDFAVLEVPNLCATNNSELENSKNKIAVDQNDVNASCESNESLEHFDKNKIIQDPETMEAENNEFLENNSQTENNNKEVASMENQNLKMQNDSQLQVNFDNISTDASNASFETNSSSSGIEKDLKETENERSKNAFEVVVPLIGNNVINAADIKPFAHRYDLAREFNRLKALAEAPYLPKLSYQEWKKQQDAKTQDEKDRELKEHIDTSVEVSVYITKTSIGILEEMQKDNPNELFIERFLLRFLRIPASTLTLVLVMPFIHILMYIRSYPDFSRKLRKVANECFWKCHVMFPIPDGYNFQTVYTSEVIKNAPDEFNLMDNYVLDYDDFDESPASESEDLGFAEDDEIE